MAAVMLASGIPTSFSAELKNTDRTLASGQMPTMATRSMSAGSVTVSPAWSVTVMVPALSLLLSAGAQPANRLSSRAAAKRRVIIR